MFAPDSLCVKLISFQVLLKNLLKLTDYFMYCERIKVTSESWMSQRQTHSPALTLPVPDVKDDKGMETITLHAVWFALLTQVCLSVS